MLSQTLSREIVLPRTDPERYRQLARAAIGLTSADVRRLLDQRGPLRSGRDGSQHDADDTVVVDERVALIGRVAARYAALHARRPELFAWAAFMAIAVNDGNRPLAELALSTAAIARTFDVDDDVARLTEDGMACTFELTLACYMDLAWGHEAYAEGGIEVVRWLAQDGAIAPAVREGFEDIERGRWLGGTAGRHLIAQGNLVLFEHQQRTVATPIFDKYRRAIELASELGLIRVPNLALAAECEAHGKNPHWAASLAGQSYGPYAPRWGWLLEHCWKPFVQLFWRNEHAAPLARAATGQREN